MRRTLLHVDMDAFFAAIEQRDRPELRGKPVIVGAAPNQRGVVAAASYEARRFGVRSAMPSRVAYRLCPHAVFLPPNETLYRCVSGQVVAILERFTPFIEKVSIDEAFLDVTPVRRLRGTGSEIARAIKDAIREELDLTASVGVASNKFLAKVASDLQKPDGLTLVPENPEAISAFLAPLPVTRIPGVGEVMSACLRKAGCVTIGDLQRTPLEKLAAYVGRREAETLAALARGEDDRALALEWEEKSLSREHTFPEDCSSREHLEATLCDLAEDVARELRKLGKYAGLVRLKLRWRDFRTQTRQKPLACPSCDDFTLREAALRLLRDEPLVQPVRLIGFGVGRLLVSPGIQLALFGDSGGLLPDRRERLSRAVDRLRERFGDDAVCRASGIRDTRSLRA